MASILATVRQSADRVVVFASDDEVYVIRREADRRWSWYGIGRDAPWNVNTYRTYEATRRQLRDWLALRHWFCVDVTTGEGTWMTHNGTAARVVDFP